MMKYIFQFRKSWRHQRRNDIVGQPSHKHIHNYETLLLTNRNHWTLFLYYHHYLILWECLLRFPVIITTRSRYMCTIIDDEDTENTYLFFRIYTYAHIYILVASEYIYAILYTVHSNPDQNSSLLFCYIVVLMLYCCHHSF